MKMKFFTLLLVNILSTLLLYAQESVLDQMDKLNAKVDLLANSADNCLPIIDKSDITLCTGAKIKIKDLMLEQKECEQKIEAMGYRTINESKSHLVDSKLWNSFFKTTKIAETIFSNKYVFFKNEAGRFDCLHELLHLYQHADNSYDKTLAKLKAALQEGVEGVGDRKVNNDKLTKGITQYRRLESISTWLTEKEVFYSFYKICPELNCPARINDILLSNLVNLREHLPWRLKNEITKSAETLLKGKEGQAIRKTSYNNLSTQDKEMVGKLAKMKWRELLSEKLGVRVVKYPIAQKLILGSESISNELFNTISTPTENEISNILSFAKTDTVNLGKYLCGAIFLSTSATRGTFVHEYTHHLQSIHNPNYCDALTKQPNIAKDFSTGKITRDEYEEKILSLKSLIWKSEYETYNLLSDKDFLSLFSIEEQDNNYIQMIIYKEKLYPDKPIENPPIAIGTQIQFEDQDDLPLVRTGTSNLILDFGAMTSTIKPRVIFDSGDPKSLLVIKSKQLRNISNELLNAPQVQLPSSINIGGSNLTNTVWVLANLKLPNATGIIGIDFFRNQDISLFPKERRLLFTKFDSRPNDSLPLQVDSEGNSNAIEIECPEHFNIRLDSGSQVRGDQRPSFKLSKCGPIDLVGPFMTNLPANSNAFDREVSINLGWPWIREHSRIDLSFKNHWVKIYR